MEISQSDIERVIGQVLRELGSGGAHGQKPAGAVLSVGGSELERIRQATPARVSIGRSGTRYPTAPYLDFLLAHAAARGQP